MPEGEASAPDRPLRIVLRPMASPLPVGFFAFGVGTLLTSLLDLHWLPPTSLPSVALIGLVFCAPLEIIGASVAFTTRDGAAATILGLFGTSWAVFGGITLLHGGGPQPALGMFDGSMAVACLLIAAAAVVSKPFFSVILAIAGVRFCLMGIGQAWPQEHVVRAVSGSVGLLLAVVSFYGAEALLLEDTRRKTILPLFRRASARQAIEGDLSVQIAALEREAGVRNQL